MGDGIALDQAVASRRDHGWSVRQRHVQKSDVGHCCHACRQPLRGLNEEVTIWTGAAIYRRFHPACAASFVLRAGSGNSRPTLGNSGVVEEYADGWRALRDSGGGGRLGAIGAARQWLLSRDPSAYNSLPGELFATVTVVENGQKKAIPGLSGEQLRMLQTRCQWSPNRAATLGVNVGEDGAAPMEDTSQEDCEECAICFTGLGPEMGLCVQLPCAPQHVFHFSCVSPWLRKASLCPTCRTDLRPLLKPATRGRSV